MLPPGALFELKIRQNAYAAGASPWTHGRRNRGVWGSMSPPHFWDQGGTGGYRGPMKMIFASIADSLYSVLYKWLNFNVVDTCQVNDICKDGLVVFPRSTPLDCCISGVAKGGHWQGGHWCMPPVVRKAEWSRTDDYSQTFTLSTVMSLISM